MGSFQSILVLNRCGGCGFSMSRTPGQREEREEREEKEEKERKVAI